MDSYRANQRNGLVSLHAVSLKGSRPCNIDETVMKCRDKWLILTDANSIAFHIGKYKDLYEYFTVEYPKLLREDNTTMEVLNTPYFNGIYLKISLIFNQS